MAAAAVATPPGDPGPATLSHSPEAHGSEETKDPKAKKKFKPLEKMRRFFKSTKKSTKTKETPDKTQSTGALHRDGGTSEDDDEGGFRPLPMGGNRSISEDSVFKPEQRDTTNIENLRPAVSMEAGVNQFKQELFSKLKSRQKSMSEDEDDGLPRSPTPQMTTADLIMGDGLKALPSQGKSSSRESDKSLISVDGSENDEDLFNSNWKKSVVSVKSPEKRSKSESEMEGSDLDLAVVKRDTQTLSSDAAKHRISIKPKTRRSSSMHHRSRTTRERTTATPPLPSLNEESPTKTSPQPILSTTNKTSIQVKAPSSENLASTPKSPAKEAEKPKGTPFTTQKAAEPTATVTIEKKPVEDKTAIYAVPHKKVEESKVVSKEPGPTQVSVGSMKTEDVKLRRDRPKSLMGNMPSQENKSDNSEFAQAFSKFKRMSLKKEVDVSETTGSFNKGEKIEPLKEININSKADVTVEVVTQSKSEEGKRTVGKLPIPGRDNSTSPVKKLGSPVSDKSPVETNNKSSVSVSSAKSPTSSNVTYVLKKEPLRTTPVKSSPEYENIPYLSKQKDGELKSQVSLKSPVSSVSSPEHDYDNIPAMESLPKPKSTESDKPKEASVYSVSSPNSSSLNKLASPKEEYRLKRQARSKTLPEQPVTSEILDAKSNNLGKSFTAPRTETYKVSDNKNLFSKSFTAGKTELQTVSDKDVGNVKVDSASKRVEPKRLSWVGSSTSDTGSAQPSWIAAAKKKQEAHDEHSKTTDVKSTKPHASGAMSKVSEKQSSVSSSGDKDLHSGKPAAKPWEKSTVSKTGQAKEQDKASVSVSKFGQGKDSDKSAKQSDKPPTGAAKFGQMKGVSIGSMKDEKDFTKPNTEKKTVDTTPTKPPLKAKPAEVANKSSTLERKSLFEKPAVSSSSSLSSSSSSSSSSNVPAWKQSLKKKGSTGISSEPKIEIIEKDQPKSITKVEEKKPMTQLRPNKNVTDKCADEVKTSRKSAVLDMVKNFQNMQVS